MERLCRLELVLRSETNHDKCVVTHTLCLTKCLDKMGLRRHATGVLSCTLISSIVGCSKRINEASCEWCTIECDLRLQSWYIDSTSKFNSGKTWTLINGIRRRRVQSTAVNGTTGRDLKVDWRRSNWAHKVRNRLLHYQIT